MEYIQAGSCGKILWGADMAVNRLHRKLSYGMPTMMTTLLFLILVHLEGGNYQTLSSTKAIRRCVEQA